MKIVSLVLRASADSFPTLHAGALEIPGLNWQYADAERGLVIVTLEDGPDYSLADSLVAVSKLPEVMSLTLAYEYTDEGLELQEA